MTLRENETGARRRVARKHKQSDTVQHRDRVLSFPLWCEINGFSKATGRRIIARGEGPPVLQLSPRRIGVRESDNAAWQSARAR
jgi:predicted DNA-binding transcriptional regulator AlpA